MTKPSNYIMPVFLALLFLFDLEMQKDALKKDVPNKNLKTNTALPYHTINTGIDGKTLMAYYLQKNREDGYFDEKYTDYSVLIDHINPDKDDYKTMCKSIITNIFNTTGNDHFQVYIYDNTKAFELGEYNYNEYYPPLNKLQADTLDAHTVAVYYGTINTNRLNNHALFFYNQTHNPHNEHEVFMVE